MRNFYEKVMSSQIDRLENGGGDFTKEELQLITLEDVKDVDIANVH